MSINRFVLGVLMFLLGSLLAANGQHRAQTEGGKPYTPTRLEWLAVNLEAENRVDLGSGSQDFGMNFLPDEQNNAIVIFASYLPSADRVLVNKQISDAREIVLRQAKIYGWSQWIKVREHIEMMKDETKP